MAYLATDRLVFLYLLSVICGVLLFVEGPDYYSSRSYKAAWELGHIVTFSVWTLSLMRTSASFVRRTIWQQLIITSFITIPLGFLIEWVQSFVGRTFSPADVVRDLSGSLLAIAFVSPATNALNRGIRRALQGATMTLILIQLYPVATALADEIIARKQFPILSDLETPFEITRWDSLSPMTLDRRMGRQGRASLRVKLLPAKYSGVGLKYFPSDWRGYSTLQFSIFNPSKTSLRISCRIHDQQHIANGEPYTDRYTSRFLLAPGWTSINIPLENVRIAPKTRLMDFGHIKNWQVFVTNLRSATTVYIDDVRLM